MNLKTDTTLKLSVLDQSSVADGYTAADALGNTVELARLADKLGYTRYWIAEHHAIVTLASPAPGILIARIGAETTRIRIGSGGVLLPHYRVCVRTPLDISFILHGRGDAMGKFLDYNADQAYLLPPSVRDVLGSGHLCFFVRRVVAKLNLSSLRDEYGIEGGPAYAPEMMVSVWLYAYALGVTSSRRLEQRIREDLAFRYLGGGATPDHWTLNAFRRRQAKGLNDLFTRVVELARASGLGRLGHVAIDSTRIAANASRNRVDTEQALREKRARIRRDIRRWQKQCDAEDPNEGAGTEVGREAMERLERQAEEIPARLERLRKSGLKKLSRTDADSRFLRERGGFTLGYTGTLAVSEDHLIVGQCVTQETNDNGLLLPLVDLVEQTCGEKPRRASADSGFFSVENLRALEERGIDGYVPDSHLGRWLNRGGRLLTRANEPAYRRMRRKLRDPAGRALYAQRKAIVEPVNGVLKEQRGMRRFRQRGLAKVRGEWALTSTAYNLTRMWRAN